MLRSLPGWQLPAIAQCLKFKLSSLASLPNFSSSAMASTSSLTQELELFDRPFTDEELQAIDDAVLSITTTTSTPSFKRHSPSGDESNKKSCRRLPESLFIYSDSFSLSPCQRRNRFSRHYSSAFTNQVMMYPEMAFRGRIVYSRSVDEVDKSAEELLSFVEAKRSQGQQAILGFDLEWRPSFRRGVAPGKAAVMQICCDNSVCYVMHIIHSGFPQNLKILLESPTSVKVGVCIANDSSKLFRDHNVSVKALEDLSDIANRKQLGGDYKKWSLLSLTKTLICKQLPKPNQIRLGNWEADIPSKEQLHYAATDAFVSWYLYEVLKTLPEPQNEKTEEAVAAAP